MNKTLLGLVAVIIVVLGAITMMNVVKTSPTEPQTMQKEASPSTEQTMTKETTVEERATGFTPSPITVKTGTKIVFVNKSGAGGNVSSAVHPTHQVYPPLNLGNFADGASVEIVFDKLGTYNYHDHNNPNRTGTITVTE